MMDYSIFKQVQNIMQTKAYITFLILSTLAVGGEYSIGNVHSLYHFVIDIFAKPAVTSQCPPGIPQVYCFVDPCSVSPSYHHIF